MDTAGRDGQIHPEPNDSSSGGGSDSAISTTESRFQQVVSVSAGLFFEDWSSAQTNSPCSESRWQGMNDSQLMPMQNMNTGLAMSTMVPSTIQPGPSGGYDFSNFPMDQNLGVRLRVSERSAF